MMFPVFDITTIENFVDGQLLARLESLPCVGQDILCRILMSLIYFLLNSVDLHCLLCKLSNLDYWQSIL